MGRITRTHRLRQKKGHPPNPGNRTIDKFLPCCNFERKTRSGKNPHISRPPKISRKKSRLLHNNRPPILPRNRDVLRYHQKKHELFRWGGTLLVVFKTHKFQPPRKNPRQPWKTSIHRNLRYSQSKMVRDNSLRNNITETGSKRNPFIPPQKQTKKYLNPNPNLGNAVFDAAHNHQRQIMAIERNHQKV